MNGRTYDPTLGRFLQADPFIQAPENMQNYNRYSYVLNNPMSMTDPSGYFFDKLFKAYNKMLGDLAPVVAIGIGIATGGWATATWYNAATVGFITGGIATGSLKGAALGALTAGVMQRIGAHFKELGADNTWWNDNSIDMFKKELHNFGGNMLTSTQIAQQVASHAMAGGVISVISGGKFGHGFVSAGFTKGVGTPALQATQADVVAGTLTSAVIGGTASVLSGGKFANGASTGAYQALFNFYGKNEAKSWITEFAGQYEISGTLMLGKYGFQFDIGLTLDADGSLFYHTQTTPYDEGFGVFGAIEIGGGLLQNKTPLVEGTSYSDSFKVAGAWRKGFGYEQSIGKGSFGVSGGKFEAGYGAMRAEGRTKTTLTHLWDF